MRALAIRHVFFLTPFASLRETNLDFPEFSLAQTPRTQRGARRRRVFSMPGIRFVQLLIGLSLGLTSILAFPGSTLAQQKPKLRPLHIALANHSVSMTAIYVAKQLGIFENYGYDARVLVLEPRAGIGALLSGDLDCYTAIGSTARAALRGAPVRVGLVVVKSLGFHSRRKQGNYQHRAIARQIDRRLHAPGNGQRCSRRAAPAQRLATRGIQGS